jgi:DNA-binding GntR family transcriptional regulator
MQQQAAQHRRMLKLVRAGNLEEARREMAASMDRNWLDGIDFSSL